MSPTRRTDLWLLAVAVMLLVAWFVFPRSKSNEDSPTSDWSDLATDPAQTISIRRGTSRLVLKYERDPSSSERYVTQAEHAAHTDPAAVDRLLHALGRLEILRRVESRVSELGLEHPALEIQLETRKGRRVVALGNAAPSPKAARYASITDRNQHQLVVLAPISVEALDIDPNDLLDQRVFDLVPSEVHDLKWSTPDGPQQITRRDDGHWTLGSHGNQRARRARVERFLFGLVELKLTKHLSSTVAAAALRSASVTELTLTSLREERSHLVTLRVGGACPASSAALGLLLEGERRVAGCVDEKAFSALIPTRAALLDDGLFSLHADEVERLTLSNVVRGFSLTRDGSEFRLDASTNTKVPLSIGNGLLESLASIHGTAIGDCGFEASSAQPLLKLDSYLLGNVKTVEGVRLGPVTDDGTRTVCRDDGVALRLTATSARLLDLSDASLRDQSLRELPPDAGSDPSR